MREFERKTRSRPFLASGEFWLGAATTFIWLALLIAVGSYLFR